MGRGERAKLQCKQLQAKQKPEPEHAQVAVVAKEVAENARGAVVGRGEVVTPASQAEGEEAKVSVAMAVAVAAKTTVDIVKTEGLVGVVVAVAVAVAVKTVDIVKSERLGAAHMRGVEVAVAVVVLEVAPHLEGAPDTAT